MSAAVTSLPHRLVTTRSLHRHLSCLHHQSLQRTQSSTTSSQTPSSTPHYHHSTTQRRAYYAPPRYVGDRGAYEQRDWHATTILSVRKGNEVVVIGDGQVSLGSTVIKDNARKVRVLSGAEGSPHKYSVITGFAGSTADCFALLDKLEKKLEQYPKQLLRAAVEMAKEWRTDKYLRQLEAFLIAVDKDISLTITGQSQHFRDLMVFLLTPIAVRLFVLRLW